MKNKTVKTLPYRFDVNSLKVNYVIEKKNDVNYGPHIIGYLRRFILKTCPKLNGRQKLYFFGLIFSIIAVFSSFFTTSDPTPHFIIFGLSLLFLGVVGDGVLLYQKTWKTLIGRAVILIIYGLVATLLYALSNQQINDIVGFQTSQITIVTPIVSLLIFPFVISIVFLMIFFASILIMPFYLIYVDFRHKLGSDRCLGQSSSKLEEFPYRTAFARILIIAFLSFFLFQLQQKISSKYSKFIEHSVSSLIYHLEAVNHSRCKVPGGYKSISVSDKEIIIVRPLNDSYEFKPITCNPIIESDQNKK